MCLIHNLTADVRISTAWLRNIYQKNSDGIGAMLIEDGKFIVKKYVPKNFKRALRWYRREVEGRNGVVHWRYATHGAVNMDNCHPYPVLTMAEDGVDMHMMHNGVMDDWDADSKLEDLYLGGSYTYRGRGWLGKGMEQDDRSDTYHFIRAVMLPLLKPSLGGDPAAIHNKAVQALIAAQIGYSNKLVFMDSTGQVVYINGHEFVEWSAYKLYCSNTYAWDYASRAHDEPQTLVRGPVVMGDPRKFTGTSATTWKAPVQTVSALLGYTNPQSRFYDHDIANPLADDDDTGSLLDAADDAELAETDAHNWRRAKALGEDWWDDFNVTAPAIAAELTKIDLACFIYCRSNDDMHKLVNAYFGGQLVDTELVDEVLSVAHIARQAAIS